MCISEFQLNTWKGKKNQRQRRDEGNPEDSDWTTILLSKKKGRKQMDQLPT